MSAQRTDELAGVSLTALGVAAIRARESLRPDRLFDDPLAAAFPAAAGRLPPLDEGDLDPFAGRARDALATSVIVRTPFLDQHVLDAAHAGCRQIVVVGAGLDTRAFRLPWPDRVRVFELDTAEVLAFKERVLTSVGAPPACERMPLEVDLRDDWPSTLRVAGLRDTEPVAWLIEGVLIYLEPVDVERVMERIGALSVPGSRLVMAGSTRALVERWQAGMEGGPSEPHRHLVELWRSGFDEHPDQWLASHGWDAALTQTCEYGEYSEALGRPMAPLGDGRPSGWLIDARR